MSARVDAIGLALTRDLLESVADEMAAVCMRTAVSPNIKERRDLSAALFRAKTGQYLGFPDSPGAASFDRNAEDPAHLDGDEERLVVASSAQPPIGKRYGNQQLRPFGGEGIGVLQRFGQQHTEHAGGHQASVMFGV